MEKNTKKYKSAITRGRILLWVTSIVLVMVNSCRDPYNHDIDPSKLDFAKNDTPQKTALDEWLLNNYTYPYNIEVKYRWDGSELEVNKTLVPPIPDRVQSIMGVVNDAWVQPYIDEAGDTFFKTFCPKQFVLVGSPNFNPGGTITLGTAEGGRKIVLFTINEFEETDRANVIEQMHTIHHEFAHILHQNIPYSNEYKTITPGDYTADWTNIPTSEAHAKGFISSYAMSAPDEDFVEMIATMLTQGERGFDRIICSIPAEGQAKLRRKQLIVENYFTSVYKINFKSLQTRTEAAIDANAPKSLISDLGFGSGQSWTTIDINPSQLPPLPADFMAIYNQTASGLAAVDGAGRVLDYEKLIFTGTGFMILEFTYHTGSSEPVTASFYFEIENDGNDILTFTHFGGDSNSEVVETGVQPMLDYFTGYTFFLDWIPNDTGDCVFDYGGIYPQEDDDLYTFGFLEAE